MYKITQSSLENIKSVFGSNTTNHSRYEIIEKRIHPLMANFEFAKPYILENSGIVHWKSKYNLDFKQYAEIQDEALKEKIDRVIYNSIHYLEEKLPTELNTEFLSNIIELPSSDAVFYVLDPDGNVKVVLTEWGFVKDELDFEKGALRKIKPASLNSGIVLFQDKTGNAIKNVSCRIDSPSFQATLQSDHLGVLKLNGINRREKINASSAESRFESQPLIFNQKDEAIIIVKLDAILNFKVLDSNGKTVPNFKLNFASEFKNVNFETNPNGEYKIIHPEFDGSFKVFFENQEYLNEPLPFGEKDYLIALPQEAEIPIAPIPLPEENEVEEGVDEVEDWHPAIFEFLTRRKKPIANQEIELYGAKEKKIYKTNSAGQIEVWKKDIAKENTLFTRFKKSDWKKDFAYIGEEKLTFIIKQRRFLWWWIPAFLLFFFLISLIPFEVNHDYVVYDEETNERLSNVNINTLNTNYSQFSVSGINSNVTNGDGEVTINYGRQSLFNQIFNPIEKSILAEKNGYNSVNATVRLGFNDNNKSWLFLNRDPDPIVVIVQPPAPEENLIPCNGGEAEDIKGKGVQLLKFNLGYANVDFLFEYYNDTEPDTIIVSTENGNELLRIEYATETTDYQTNYSKILNSSSAIVIVEVRGKSNWGIRVNCPD
ncbi:MAG: hypothetical protein GQ574_27455 [Crocinitomix sp.]|nr:hypothetical protein [Crocinitomix sp.]